MTNYITKDQIRKGDVLRVTFEPFKGIVLTREGTAWEEDIDGDWYALTDEEVSFPDFLTFIGGRTINKIELLSRPMPTEPGAVFRATEIRGEKCDVVVLATEQYIFADDGGLYVSSKPVNGYLFHSLKNITEWEPYDG